MKEYAVKNAVRARDGYRCVDCGMTQKTHRRRTTKQLQVHRKIPGSQYTVDGCVTVCFWCHAKRHGKTPVKKLHKKPSPAYFEKLRIRADLAKKIKMLSIYHGLKFADYVNSILVPAIERDYRETGLQMDEPLLAAHRP